jgi:hypothetical protein
VRGEGLLTMRPTLLLLMMVGLAAPGCGGGDAGQTPARDAQRTRDHSYVATADAICAEANRKEAALGTRGPGWIYDAQFDDAEFLGGLTTIGRTTLERLRGLDPPAEDRAAARAVTSSIARMLRALEDHRAALQGGRKDDRAGSIRLYEAGYADLSVAAGPLGLTECQGVLL